MADLPFTLVADDSSARAALRRVAEAAERAAASTQRRLAQTTRELDTDPKD